MYDVKEFHFNKEECWFKDNCNKYQGEDCNCGCSIYCQYYYLVNLANIPKNKQYPNQLKLKPGDDLKKYQYLAQVKDNINQFVKDGCNLYLYSPNYGNGKTTWAIKLMSKYFSNIWPGNGTQCRGLFINVDELIMNKKAQMDKYDDRFDEMLKLIPTIDLVVWDDIGCSRLSDFDHTFLFPLINSRIVNNKANIFTSNVIDGDLVSNMGGRLASRILETSTVVMFNNTPQRKPKGVI